jgi:hypothetical protein
MFWSRAAQALAPRVGILDFDIVWNLSIVIWDFSAVFGKANRFYLNQLEAVFDVSLNRSLDVCGGLW